MAEVRGNQWAFTATPGGIAVEVSEANAFVFKVSHEIEDTTPCLYVDRRFAMLTRVLRGSIRCTHQAASTPPPIPTGTNGTTGSLVLTIASGETYTLANALVFDMEARGTSLNGGPAQVFEYQFVGSATSTSSNLTLA